MPIELSISKLITTFALGQHDESAAEIFLQEEGLQLLAKNYRCKCGEIDLIMQDDETVVFVEVRYRKTDSNNYYGNGLTSITASKQRKIVLAAKFYLSLTNQYYQSLCRFDIISVTTKAIKIKNKMNASFLVIFLPVLTNIKKKIAEMTTNTLPIAKSE